MEALVPRARVEAVLWLATEPLSLRRIARLADLGGPAEARDLLGELDALYERRGAAFELVSLGGGWQLRSRPQYSSWIRRSRLTPSVRRTAGLGLSGPALETLVIVAHKQPVMRAEVEAIRGVACGELLRQLLEADLLRIVGRSEELGRPLLYGTTGRFLRMFGLRNLEDLASCDEFAFADGVDHPAQPTTSNASPT